MNFGGKSIWHRTGRQSIAAFVLAAIFCAPFANGAQQTTKPSSAAQTVALNTKRLTAEQKILHVLNRLGYGARPGEVERVRQIGLEKYVEQQLNPATIDDRIAAAKVQNLNVLQMSNAELFAKYPNQAGVLQIIADRSGLNRKQLRGELKEQKQATKTAQSQQVNGGTNDSDSMPAPQKADATTPTNGGAPKTNADLLMQNRAGLSDADRREYQRQIAEVYREQGFGRPAEITQQLIASRILRAVYSERQLNEQMVDFWTNHFNVYNGKASTRWFLPEYDRDAIRPNALGNFRDLLIATAKSPAMLFYLDNFQSVAPNPNQNNRRAERLQRLMQTGGQIPGKAKNRFRERFPDLSDEEIEQRLAKQMQNPQRNRRGINENYARELMELHTLGVDGGYTQKDITEVARCFTGWTIVDARGYKDLAAKMLAENPNKVVSDAQFGNLLTDAESGTFRFNPRQHDNGEKIVLGQKIPAGGGMEDGLKVIEILVKQPATAKFIARKLAVKFVNDNPSDALVNQVADAFQKSNGDIKATLRALFTAPEFFAAENYRAKIKTPFEVVISSIRTLGADTNASPALQALLTKMGEPLYGYVAPTGYPDTAQDWVNTGALLERLNFGLALAANRIAGTRTDLTKFAAQNSDDKEKATNAFLSLILNNEVSPNTKTTIAKQLAQPLPEPKLAPDNAGDGTTLMTAMQRASNGNGGGKKSNGMNAANRLLPASGNPETVKIVGLILGSPEFQRQ